MKWGQRQKNDEKRSGDTVHLSGSARQRVLIGERDNAGRAKRSGCAEWDRASEGIGSEWRRIPLRIICQTGKKGLGTHLPLHQRTLKKGRHAGGRVSQALQVEVIQIPPYTPRKNMEPAWAQRSHNRKRREEGRAKDVGRSRRRFTFTLGSQKGEQKCRPSGVVPQEKKRKRKE